MTDGVLVLVRHGQSEWNKLNLFTGWKDPDLTAEGIAEAERAAANLKAAGISFEVAFTSVLRRAQHTLEIIMKETGQTSLPVHNDQALNERDYGDLSGLNKDDARAKWGEEQVHIWRRSFDVPPPGGESLKMTAERTLPYFDANIRPAVMDGKTVIVAAHGNSLRSIIMQIEQLTPEQILKVEVATGVPIVYRFNRDGSIAEKSILE